MKRKKHCHGCWKPSGPFRQNPECQEEWERCHRNHLEELHRLHRSLRFFRPVILLFTLALLYLLFHWAGFKAIGLFFAAVLLSKEILQYFLFRRLEKRVFIPIEQLQTGFNQIAQGNYQVVIASPEENAFSQLIDDFNQMARKLQESEKRNREYEENRRALIANISHDLKTPMTSIQGYLEMLLEGNGYPAEKAEKYLRIIASDTGYVNRLIDDLFLFAKLDMDKVEMNYERVGIRDYMQDLVTEFTLELEEHGCRLEYQDILKDECVLRIDRKRVYQALRNLVTNALKYGPEEGLKLEIRLSRRENSLLIEIQDNGPGIAADQIPHIFDRFYRIDSARSKDLTGSGLGLAIARELVEAQKGRIEVESPGGSGTCFRLEFPLDQAEEKGEA